MDHLPARTGWEWLKQGVGLFRKQPAALTTLLFTSILVALVIGVIPYVGTLLVGVLVPSFSMAILRACQMIDNGERVTPAVLLTGFRQPALARLWKVGVVYTLVFAVLILVASVATPESMRHLSMDVKLEPGDKLPFSGSDFLTMLGLAILQNVSLLTLCFAAPLAYWKHMGPGKATFYSFFAVVRAARVFGMLLLSWFGMFAGALIVVVLLTGLLFNATAITQAAALWLMFLFILFLQCAIYAGYRDIFGKPPAQPA